MMIPTTGFESSLSYAPRYATAADHAAAWRLQAGVGPTDRLDVISMISKLGYQVEMTPLAADAGRLEASIVPSRFSTFSIRVDDRLTPTGAWEGSGSANSMAGACRAAVRFRAAHELGHTFFFERTEPPMRHRDADQAEERFCDDFAACVLVAPGLAAMAVARDPAAVVALAVHHDAPIEQVLRSATLGGARVRALGGVLLADGGQRVDMAFACADGGFSLRRSSAAQVELVSLQSIRTVETPLDAPFLLVESTGMDGVTSLLGATAARGWWDQERAAE